MADGKTYQIDYYNLDVIISVSYRVKSKRGTQFRIWATGILKEYMRKGFALDDERLRNLGGGGYFKELVERIRTSGHLRKCSVVKCWEKEFMGLTAFAGSQPTLREAVIAKNYLDEKELRAIGQLVSGYLNFAERQAERE